MCFANGRCLLCIAFLVLFAALLILAAVHRVRAKKKVLALTPGERVRLLNELAEPFGFAYLPAEDIFTSRLDAWQRDKGYEAKYDTMAVGAGMVIDAFPVYFNYEGRTWLVEFWKGQYGINTGGEVGIYHAKGVIPPHAYHTAHFEAVSDAELPRICSCLDTAEETFYEICARHWWLTGFRMGVYTKPSRLRLATTLIFPEQEMALAFWEGEVNRLLASAFPAFSASCTRSSVYVAVKGACKELALKYFALLYNISKDEIVGTDDQGEKNGVGWPLTNHKAGFSTNTYDPESAFQIPLSLICGMKGKDAWLFLDDNLSYLPPDDIQ